MLLCPPQISHVLTWDRTRAPAVASQRLTAWAMARPLRTSQSRPSSAGRSVSVFLTGMVGGGVQLGPLGTAATNRPIMPAPGVYDDGEIGGMMIGRENLPQCRFVHHKPHMLSGCEPGAAAVGSQRLTAWATARPSVTVWWLFTECDSIADFINQELEKCNYTENIRSRNNKLYTNTTECISLRFYRERWDKWPRRFMRVCFEEFLVDFFR
jgi:hypothetical protein